MINKKRVVVIHYSLYYPSDATSRFPRYHTGSAGFIREGDYKSSLRFGENRDCINLSNEGHYSEINIDPEHKKIRIFGVNDGQTTVEGGTYLPYTTQLIDSNDYVPTSKLLNDFKVNVDSRFPDYIEYGGDCNTFTSGMALMYAPANAPTNDWYAVYAVGVAGTNVQFAIHLFTGIMYYRYAASGNWSQWKIINSSSPISVSYENTNTTVPASSLLYTTNNKLNAFANQIVGGGYNSFKVYQMSTTDDVGDLNTWSGLAIGFLMDNADGFAYVTFAVNWVAFQLRTISGTSIATKLQYRIKYGAGAFTSWIDV